MSDGANHDQQRPAGRRATVSLLLALISVLALMALSGGIAHAAVAELSITEAGFGPGVLEVAPGTDVIWTNDGTSTHDVVSDTDAFPASGPLGPGESYTVILEASGTYRYHSSLDAGFSGEIVVTGDASATSGGVPSARAGDPTTNQAVPAAPDSPTSIPTEMAFTGAAETIGLAVGGALVLFLGWTLTTGAGPGLGPVAPWRGLAFADPSRFGFTDERLPRGRWRRTPRSTTQANLLPQTSRASSRHERRARFRRR